MIVRVSEQNIMDAASIHSSDTPSLWILENNVNAERLYYCMGFTRTGRINTITDKIAEIELSLK